MRGLMIPCATTASVSPIGSPTLRRRVSSSRLDNRYREHRGACDARLENRDLCQDVLHSYKEENGKDQGNADVAQLGREQRRLIPLVNQGEGVDDRCRARAQGLRMEIRVRARGESGETASRGDSDFSRPIISQVEQMHMNEQDKAGSAGGDHEKSIEIIVNARPYEWPSKTISYGDVIKLVYGDNPPTGENIIIRVTYSKGEGDKTGSLEHGGDPVKVKKDMVFSVKPTDKS